MTVYLTVIAAWSQPNAQLNTVQWLIEFAVLTAAIMTKYSSLNFISSRCAFKLFKFQFGIFCSNGNTQESRLKIDVNSLKKELEKKSSKLNVPDRKPKTWAIFLSHLTTTDAHTYTHTHTLNIINMKLIRRKENQNQMREWHDRTGISGIPRSNVYTKFRINIHTRTYNGIVYINNPR